MAGMGVYACTLALIAVAVSAHSLTIDEDAANRLQTAAGSVQIDSQVAIVLRGPHGRGLRREDLLQAKGADDNYISLYYTRKTNKVVLESLDGGHLQSVSWSLGSHSKNTLTLTVSSNKVKLSAGCRSLQEHDIPERHNLLALLGSQKTKLYHEEHAPVQVYASDRAALDSLKCNEGPEPLPPTLLTVDDDTKEDSDVEEVREFIKKDARWKRHDEMLGDEYRANDIDPNGVPSVPQRGDIPSIAIETCDDEVVRQLQYLRQIIESLRREIGEQKGTIESLRGQLRLCCNRPQPTPPPPERCTSSSCYPGY